MDSQNPAGSMIHSWVEWLGTSARELDAMHHRSARSGPDVWGLTSRGFDDYRLLFDEEACRVAELCRAWVHELVAEAGIPVPRMTSDPLPPTPKIYDAERPHSLKEATDPRQLVPGDPEAYRSFASDLTRFPELFKEVSLVVDQIHAAR